jgi:hypothetical protein
MKAVKLTGILLVVPGVLALVYQGFTYTRRERALDIGPIHTTKDTQERVPWSRIRVPASAIAEILEGPWRLAWLPAAGSLLV